MLVDEQKTVSPMSNVTGFPPSIQVVSLSSYMNQSAVCGSQNVFTSFSLSLLRSLCYLSIYLQLPLDSVACEQTWKGDEYWYKTKFELYQTLANISTKTGVWVECEDCDLGFPVVKSQWTADTLISIFQNASIHDSGNKR